AAAMEQARSFRRASHEAATAEAEVFRTAILDALGHEFKTPLATILAVVGGMRESARLGVEDMELAGIVEQEVSRLNQLTGRLLSMARSDREEVNPRMGSRDIGGLVAGVVERYPAQPRDRQITVSGPREAVAPADRQLFDLAITQLLDNAFKYSTSDT